MVHIQMKKEKMNENGRDKKSQPKKNRFENKQ